LINKIYSLKIIDPETGLNYDKSKIYENLRNLVKSANNNYGIGLGILTGSENRAIWSDAYSKLTKSNFILNENFYLKNIYIFKRLRPFGTCFKDRFPDLVVRHLVINIQTVLG